MDAFSISLSGLAAQTTHLAATANNIANMQTPGYKAHRVVMATGPYGGVSAVLARDLSPGYTLPQTPGLPVGETESSNVDLATELVNLMTIQHGFEANLKVLKTLFQNKGTVLDIIS